jgi:hypothetical protein
LKSKPQFCVIFWGLINLMSVTDNFRKSLASPSRLQVDEVSQIDADKTPSLEHFHPRLRANLAYKLFYFLKINKLY